jgi:hypothetical protein
MWDQARQQSTWYPAEKSNPCTTATGCGHQKTESNPAFMNIRILHALSGQLVAVFVGLHLLNHVYSILGVAAHLALMDTLRHFYRNIFLEALLLLAVLIQIISGLRLFGSERRTATSLFEKIHVWTGLYLAIFFVMHLGAVLGGRLLLHLDTNFYFGAAGLNTYPFSLFFIPYYGLAILSFFGHIAAIHHKKMEQTVFGITPAGQSKAILIIGMCLTVVIFYGLTNRFNGIILPQEYKVLVGQ